MQAQKPVRAPSSFVLSLVRKTQNSTILLMTQTFDLHIISLLEYFTSPFLSY